MTPEQREAPAILTDEKALGILSQANGWLIAHLEEVCQCGACFVCAFRHVETRLADLDAAEEWEKRLREAIDFLYDAWVDTDVHPRCAYGACPACDAVSEMAAVILGEYSGEAPQERRSDMAEYCPRCMIEFEHARNPEKPLMMVLPPHDPRCPRIAYPKPEPLPGTGCASDWKRENR